MKTASFTMYNLGLLWRISLVAKPMKMLDRTIPHLHNASGQGCGGEVLHGGSGVVKEGKHYRDKLNAWNVAK